MTVHMDAAALVANSKPLPEEYKVRLAVEADIPALVAIGRELAMENACMPFSERRAYEMALRGVRQQGAAIGVIGAVGAPEAVICMQISQYWYSDFAHLEELFIYVRPEFRQSARAKCLIQYAKMCSDHMKLPLLVGILSQERTEAKIRLYKRQLGEPSGAYWLFNGKTGV